MTWPPPNEFRDAVRNPAAAFADPDLAVVGRPEAHPGDVSRVYQLCAAGGRSWAVKCFNRIDDAREAQYVAVRGPDLWRAYGSRDGLLFAAADFRAPGGSRLLRKLWKSTDPALRGLVGALTLACGRGDRLRPRRRVNVLEADGW